MDTLSIATAVALGVGCACLVIWPLVFPDRAAGDGHDRQSLVDELAEEKEKLLVALKEIEFDHRTSKLSDEDFHKLDSDYRARALDCLRRIEELGLVSDADPLAAVEADVRRALRGPTASGPRSCLGCGERLASASRFCSNCGQPVVLAEA